MECGDGITQIVPVIEGVVDTNAIRTLDIAGSDITEEMANLLNKKGYSFSTDSTADMEVACKIKQTLGYVALDFYNESKHEERYRLPDGEVITVGKERFKCTEVLFQPSLIDLGDIDGIHEAIVESISECDPSVQKELYGNIVLSGGSTLLPGFAKRLKKEVEVVAPSEDIVHVVEQPNRKYSAWIGGSKLSESLDEVLLSSHISYYIYLSMYTL